jgi:hypothetical protein
MMPRHGQVAALAAVALVMVAIAFFAAGRAAYEAAQEPERNWQDLCRRTVAAEAEIRALQRTIDELQVLILWGSARVDRRLQALENGTRPIINIDKGTVYGGGRDLVIQEVKEWKR